MATYIRRLTAAEKKMFDEQDQRNKAESDRLETEQELLALKCRVIVLEKQLEEAKDEEDLCDHCNKEKAELLTEDESECLCQGCFEKLDDSEPIDNPAELGLDPAYGPYRWSCGDILDGDGFVVCQTCHKNRDTCQGDCDGESESESEVEQSGEVPDFQK